MAEKRLFCCVISNRMDPKFRSSFIPKKSIVTKISKPKRYHSFNILTFVSTVIFVVSLVVAGGVFVYGRLIEDSIDRKGIELSNVLQTIDLELIEEFKALDKKLRTAEELLSRHTAMTLFFDFLESSTLQNVQYNDFNYILDPDGTININMEGVARSFNSVTLQSDIFRDSDIILDPVFSNLKLDELGNVLFNITAKVDPSFVLYRNTFSADKDFESL